MAIARTPIIDDDGSGQTGTVLDNAWKQELYDQIDTSQGAGSAARFILVGNALGVVPAGTNPTNPVAFYQFPVNTLGIYETVQVELELHLSPPTAWPGVTVNWWRGSESVTVLDPVAAFGALASTNFLTGRLSVRRHPTTDAYVFTQVMGGGDGGAVSKSTSGAIAAVWNSELTGIYLSIPSVPAGCSLYWKWSVNRFKG